MRRLNHTVLAALAALLASSAALAQVSVSYTKPDDYTDVPRNAIERERTLKEFSDYFKTLDKKLPAGQQLKIEVLDIDLAGRLYPRRAGDDIRIMNGGADWPHMHLKYTLEQNGQVLRSGDEQLSNMNYQGRLGGYFDSDPLRYEKQMLDDWFNKSIVPKVARR
ncbi:DUF3016 domain-containing protein [Duganella radicis]|uniref:DUF3016 domain-containing protein n=1 Tax=Duganella radicis TaxID=551988 RepID=A0A6L6PF02_9BURK|nr:DUF3016 domain-containing protein [Duganella radicis]MTV37574.1 DUF3016 domain-containing protein [Duganella radicis]